MYVVGGEPTQIWSLQTTGTRGGRRETRSQFGLACTTLANTSVLQRRSSKCICCRALRWWSSRIHCCTSIPIKPISELTVQLVAFGYSFLYELDCLDLGLSYHHWVLHTFSHSLQTTCNSTPLNSIQSLACTANPSQLINDDELCRFFHSK
jgi:hypothetical protein